MRASQCDLDGSEQQLTEHLTEDIYIFQSKRKQRPTPNDTQLRYEAREYTLHQLYSLYPSSPGKPGCEPMSSLGPVSFIFTVLLTWQ